MKNSDKYALITIGISVLLLILLFPATWLIWYVSGWVGVVPTFIFVIAIFLFGIGMVAVGIEKTTQATKKERQEEQNE